MNTLNIIFGVVTIISAIITVYQYVTYEKFKAKNSAQVDILNVKLNQVHNSLIPIHYSLSRLRKTINESDQIENSSIERNIRTIEVQLESMIIPIQKEVEKINTWQDGGLTPSNFKIEE